MSKKAQVDIGWLVLLIILLVGFIITTFLFIWIAFIVFLPTINYLIYIPCGKLFIFECPHYIEPVWLSFIPFFLTIVVSWFLVFLSKGKKKGGKKK